MGKPKVPSQKGKYSELHRRLNKYSLLVQNVYDQFNLEASKIALITDYLEGDKPFRFADFPQTTARVAKLKEAFSEELQGLIYSSTSEEWKNSNLIQDMIADKALKYYGAVTNGIKHRVYYQSNNDALKAFQQRRDNGMNLSKKIWNQSEDYVTELECALSSAIEKGTSAVKLSKRVSKYLKNYDQLQKDYKERFGKAAKCSNCEYRSIRLARSEINMAYRSAEQERWKQFDFVLGYEVKLTQNGHHVSDICDTLAGRYPKDFKFVGWHPNCMCYVVPILKSEDEFWNDSIVEPVQDVPDGFKEWVGNNADRIEKANKKGSLPYFIKDNPNYISVKDNVINVGWYSSDQRSTISIIDGQNIYLSGALSTKNKKDEILANAEKRHNERSEDDRYWILYGWNTRRLQRLVIAQRYEGLLPEECAGTFRYIEDSIELGDFEDAARRINLLQAAVNRHKARTNAYIRNIQDKADIRAYGQAYVDNVHDIEDALGIKRIKRMTHEEANTGNVNPNYGQVGYNINCSTCSGTYILRRMGFDVEALPNTPDNPLVEELSKGMDVWSKWRLGNIKFNSTIVWQKKKGLPYMTGKDYADFVEEYTKEPGIYEFVVGWFGNGDGMEDRQGHSTLLERKPNGTLIRIEQQTMKSTMTLRETLLVLTRVPGYCRGIMRVDNAMFNPKYAGIVRKVKK